MDVSVSVWLVTCAVITAIMIADLTVVDVRHVDFGPRNALVWVVIYVAMAGAVALAVSLAWGTEFAGQFIAGYVTEYSLSVDNLFVFSVLMASFTVPHDLRHRVLLYGILIALVLRTGLILLGAAALHRYAAVFYLFAAVLAWTAWKVWGNKDDDLDPRGNALVRFAARHLRTSPSYHGDRLTARVGGHRVITPLALVVFAIGTTDLLFALDSIPAVYGLTQQPYIAFLVNACALMGLRQLFFLLDAVLRKLAYLNRGLAVILSFIAVKLLLEAIAATTAWKAPQVSVPVSLAVIVTTLVVTALWSIVAPPAGRDAKR